jgi:hypothetical protein
MRYFKYIRNLVIGSIFGAFVLVGTAGAQNVNREYRDWQMAQQRAVQEHNDYLRTGSMRDYNQWQAAERRAQEQYRQYQAASSRYGYGFNNNYNNGYYNNSYNNNNNTRYRVYRNGSYYSTDYRGAELLRQAVRNGYSLGYQEGQRDRMNRRGFNYSNESAYRNGTYGYQSYVDRNQYRYYFQQGYQRGYEDGFNSTYRYGVRSGNGFDILGNVLNTILNIAQ